MVAAEVSYEPAGFGLCRWRGTCGELQEIGASAGTINRGGTGLIPIGDCSDQDSCASMAVADDGSNDPSEQYNCSCG